MHRYDLLRAKPIQFKDEEVEVEGEEEEEEMNDWK